MNGRLDGVAIAVGGAVGAIARVLLGEALPVGTGLPWATLIANVAGAALLGAIATVPVAAGRLGELRMPLVGIGFCGGLTTFSALSWELFDLIDRGSVAVAVAYATLSLVLGMAALVAARRVVLIRLEEGERA